MGRVPLLHLIFFCFLLFMETVFYFFRGPAGWREHAGGSCKYHILRRIMNPEPTGNVALYIKK